MTIWGTLGGAAAGFAIGGPIGALIGALAGLFVVDRGLMAPPPTPPRETIAFTVGLVALAAKMAKADGVVTRDEVAAFRRLVIVEPQDEPRVIKLFDLAKQSTAGFEAYAGQLRSLLASEPGALEDLMDALFEIAKADGAVHEAETAYLAEVARLFGFDAASFATIEARHVAPDKADPYVVLGLKPGASEDEVRSAWRRLVKEHHPDQLIARGVPPEFIAVADAKLAAINAAYNALTRPRSAA